jgi:peptide/nickel transport system permease protein
MRPAHQMLDEPLEEFVDKLAFTINRLLQAIPTVIAITVLVFLMVHLIPGDPATVLLGLKATPEKIAALTEHLGLDKPLWTQFLIFVKDLFTGDLGDSLISRLPVIELIRRRLPITLFLAGYAAVLGIAMTIPLSLISALKKDSLIDQIIRAVFVTVMSTPGFWIGILLLIVLGVQIPIFPVGGIGETFTDRLYYLFLPALTLGLRLTAVLTRNLRDGIITALSSEHVVFARTKGLWERLVLSKHVLRNAMVSTLTLLGVYMSWLVGGSVIIETVFAIPGVGWTMVQAITGRDYPVVQGLTFTFGILVSLVYLITDIAYSFLDPRVSL